MSDKCACHQNKASIAPQRAALEPAKKSGHDGLMAMLASSPVWSRLSAKGDSPVPPESLRGVRPFLGNHALQTALARQVASPESQSCGCGGGCALCAQKKRAASPLPAKTEPPANGEMPEELKATTPRPRAASPIDPSKMGGTVICKNKKLEVWTNPTNSACIEPCVRKHEEKHVRDFLSDPSYKDYCNTGTEGETIDYHNCSDAVRFENAATDLEIDCLDKSIPGASKSCQAEMRQRKDVDLPAYKKQVASCGC